MVFYIGTRITYIKLNETEVIVTQYRARTFLTSDRTVDKYLYDISEVPLLKPDEEVRLAIKIRKGDTKALAKLIQGNLRFVVSVAKEYRNQGLPLCDLINEGNLGLIKAAKRFDETKGFKFISYAVWWIRQGILQALAEHARVVRLPLNKVGSVNRIGKTYNNLEQEYEREPTLQEVANALKITALDVSMAFQLAAKHISLDAPLKEKESGSLMEVTVNNSLKPPDHLLLEESLKMEIAKVLQSLSSKEAEILRLYFGLNLERPLTLEEIGQRFRLTRERVRQIKERAIARLRHQSRSKSLRQYLG